MAFRKRRKDPFAEIQACLQKRDYKGSMEWFNLLLKRDPKNTQIRLRCADTLVLAGSKREAIKQYRIVADQLADKGFMIRAIAINKKILQLDPSQTDVHEKLAAMNDMRSSGHPSRAALSQALYHPGKPLERTEVEPPRDRPETSMAEEATNGNLPELSLEDTLAMEFGTSQPGDVPPAESLAEPTPAEAEGLEQMEEKAAESQPLADEPPSFTEEAIALGAPAEPKDEDEIEIVGFDEESSEPEIEIVLEDVAGEPSVGSSPDIVLELTETPAVVEIDEVDVVALHRETESALAADEAESLLGALGEDIDSLIDSIIDDVGSSAKRSEQEEEPAPTHIPLFSDLSTSEFIDVAILLVRRVAKQGETIVREGDPGESMFIVSTGEVHATVERDGKQVVVATLKDGNFFGEMAVLSGEPRTATVTAVRMTELLELSRENLTAICRRHPHVEAKIRLAYDERASRSESF
ncbi:MAG TPA: cyclic nucleotide-binding domain-containing protein [Vicinamibacteria bacterium]|nr:cyclic nucleotide-binding domain-containing protein [Vicinamibacteria bacterium]